MGLEIKPNESSIVYRYYFNYVRKFFLTKIPKDWNEELNGSFHDFKQSPLTEYIETKGLEGKEKVSYKTVQNFVWQGNTSKNIFFIIIKLFLSEDEILSYQKFTSNPLKVTNADIQKIIKSQKRNSSLLGSKKSSIEIVEKTNPTLMKFYGFCSLITVCSDKKNYELSFLDIKRNTKVYSEGMNKKKYNGKAIMFNQMLHVNLGLRESHEQNYCIDYLFRCPDSNENSKVKFLHGFRSMKSATNRPYVSRVILFNSKFWDKYEEVPMFPFEYDAKHEINTYNSERLKRLDEISNLNINIEKSFIFLQGEENNMILGFLQLERDIKHKIEYGEIFFNSSVKLAQDLQKMNIDSVEYNKCLKKCLQHLDMASKHLFQNPNNIKSILYEINEGSFSKIEGIKNNIGFNSDKESDKSYFFIKSIDL